MKEDGELAKQFDLTGKVALITGASRGIGRSMAVAFAEAGADVFLAARSETGIAETAEAIEKTGGRAYPLAVDVTDLEATERAVDNAYRQVAKIDVLVNNAGINLVKPFLEFTPAEWTAMIQTNVMGALHFSHAVGRYMTKHGGGSIITTGSVYGLIGAPGNVVYCLTKGAIMQLTKALAIEWARYKIRVNAICPGLILTALSEPYFQTDEDRAAALRAIPMRRLGTPGDIAPLAVYLASDAARYVTGQFFVVDGGYSAR